MSRWLRNIPMSVRSLIFIVLAMVAVLALFAYLGSDALDNSTTRMTEMDRRFTSMTATAIDSQLRDAQSVLSAWVGAVPPGGQQTDTDMETAALKQLQKALPCISEVFLLDDGGRIAGSYPEMQVSEAGAVQADPAVERALQSGEFQLGDFSRGQPDGKPRILILVPRKGADGRVQAWVGASIDIRLLVAAVNARITDLQAGSRVFLIDRTGQTVVIGADGAAALQEVSYADKLIPFLTETEPQTRNVDAVLGDRKWNVIISFSSIADSRMGFVIEQPSEMVYQLLDQLRWQFVVFGAVTLLVAFLLTGIEDWLVLAPIRDLLAATRRMTAGDLATPLKIVGRDETSALSREFEVMRRRLSDWSGQLSAAVDRQTHKLSTLYAIDRVASSTLELKEVLTESLQRVLEVTKMDAGGYFLDSDGRQPLPVHLGLSDDLALSVQQVDTRKGVAAAVFERKRAVILPLTEGESDPLAPVFSAAGFRTLVATPLLAKGAALGGLILVARDKRTFAGEDIDLLESIGQQIGSAVHNAQLYSSEMRRREEAERLYEAARAAGASLSLREVCERILRELQRVVPYDRASVQWLEGDRLTVVGAHGYPEGESIVGLMYAAAEGAPEWKVIRESQPFILEDRGVAEELASSVTRAWLGVPMRYGDRLVGLIVLEKSEPGYYDREHARLASAFATQVAAAMENARLFTNLEENLARISSLYELGAEIISASMPQATARAVALKVAQAARALSAVVTLFDSGGHVTLRVGADAKGILPPEPTPRPNGTTMRVYHSGENLIVPEPDKEQNLITPRLAAAGVQALIGLPLHATEHVIGTLFVRYPDRHMFSEDEVRALTTFANTAATALERARLLEETERRLEEIGALYDLSSVLRGSMTLQEMLPLVLQKAAAMARADAASLSLVEGNEVVCHAAEGFSEDVTGRRILLGEGIIGGVAASGEMRHTPFLPHDPMIAPPAGSVAVVRGVGSALCLPLRTADQVIGAIFLLSYGRTQFRENEIRLLTAAADIAGGAIHRAIIFEQLEHRVHELGSLYEFGTAASTSLRLEDVVHLVLKAAPLAVHAEAGCIFLWDDMDESLLLWELDEKSNRKPGTVKYRAGEGLVGWVFMEKHPALVPDVTKDPRWKSDPEVERIIVDRARDALAVPLIRGKKALGVLMALNRLGGESFTEADQSLLSALAGQTATAIENAMLFEDVRDLSVDAISSLATAIDARDPYTRGHSEDVTQLVISLARQMGWEGSDLEMIEFAALLHDVGKIAVPDNILRKPSVLMPEEWDVIYLHPYHSAQIVRPVEPLRRIIPWIYHHHERWDGGGYPDGLKGEEIPDGARIIAVVDAFNAITTDRPYHKALAASEALREIKRSSGSQFDPKIVKEFLQMMRKDRKD
jgi:HD-GYP domain-containing protein (c-di-GMP phosphodiesterase class II)/putative methionine-R-sulfoxide reductase with GAF domain/HAMP domain-containing protein